MYLDMLYYMFLHIHLYMYPDMYSYRYQSMYEYKIYRTYPRIRQYNLCIDLRMFLYMIHCNLHNC